MYHGANYQSRIQGYLIQCVINILLLLAYNNQENAMGSLFQGLKKPSIVDKRSKKIRRFCC